jgi:hypothetical protein
LVTPTQIEEGTNDGDFLQWSDSLYSWISHKLAAGDISIGAFTAGSIPFLGAGALEEDNANLFYDQTNVRLGIGTSTPTASLDLPASTVAAASLRIRTGVAPTAPNEGDVWFDSTQKRLMAYLNGLTRSFVGTLFTATANGTCGNTAAETSIVGTGVGTMTLPANFFAAGKSIRVTVYGAYSTKSSSPGTLVIKIKLGSTIILALPATTPTANLTKVPFVIDAIITCRTTGATGTVIGQGDLFLATATAQTGVSYTLPNQGSDALTAITSFDTTASKLVDVTATWGTADAGNTISSTNVVLEVLN